MTVPRDESSEGNLNPLLAWHFLSADGLTRHESPIKVEPGQTLTVDPPLKLCLRGLHASVMALDALFYAPGPVVCRVELSGKILHGSDKVCAQHRKVLWMADATRVLHLFACDEAERLFQADGITDSRYIDAIETKRRWLEGKATNEELDAARTDVRIAVRVADWAAAWSASLSALLTNAPIAALSAARAVVDEDGGSFAVNERLTAALMRLQPGETSQ